MKGTIDEGLHSLGEYEYVKAEKIEITLVLEYNEMITFIRSPSNYRVGERGRMRQILEDLQGAPIRK